MWSDSSFVFALIAVTAALMASNKVCFDIVALMVVLAMMLSGVLTVGVPLLLLTWLTTLVVAPLVFPYGVP